jgi:hypothetical protein
MAEPPAKRKRAARNQEWIDWKKARAREIILDDLMEGRLPLDEAEMWTEKAWAVYQKTEEFKGGKPVVFDQFKERLKDHRKQVAKLIRNSERDLLHDRELHPRETHNKRGEPIFDLSPAKPLLRADVAANRHVGIGPREFQKTRPEYMEFRPEIFNHRIIQEVRRVKFVNGQISRHEFRRVYPMQTQRLLEEDVAAGLFITMPHEQHSQKSRITSDDDAAVKNMSKKRDDN